MNHKYKYLLIIITILLISIILVAIGYNLYQYNIDKNSAEVIINEELSINYLNGRNFKFMDSNKEINFSVINDSDDNSVFHIILENISISDSDLKVTYNLKENNKEIVKNTELLSGNYNTIFSFVNIGANETKSYKLIINNPKKSKIELKLNVEKSYQSNMNFSQIILNENLVNKEPKTKVGELSVNDEGLILDIDDDGNTFYYRGNVKNNYVNFANKLWRIVKINGNGTIKLILDNNIDKTIVYDDKLSNDRLNYLQTFSNNKTYIYLNEWYKENLSNYDNYIVQSKFCIDVNKEGNNLSNYFRINLSNNPTFNCLGNKNNSKIGLLTIDEVIYAGASLNEQNQYFYLYNSNILDSWWTISPAKDSLEGIYYYEVTSNGGILMSSTGESTKSLRPVINLNKNIEMKGKGTIDDPYTLK